MCSAPNSTGSLKTSGAWALGTEDVFAAFLGVQLVSAAVLGVLGYRVLGLRWSSLLLDRALTNAEVAALAEGG